MHFVLDLTAGKLAHLCLRARADSGATDDFSGPEREARARVRGSCEAAICSELEDEEDRLAPGEQPCISPTSRFLLTSQTCED